LSGRPPYGAAGRGGAAQQHLRRRRPVRPFRLAADPLDACPFETGAPDANAVAERLPVRLNQKQEPLGCVDDNRSRSFRPRIVDLLPAKLRLGLGFHVRGLACYRGGHLRPLQRAASQQRFDEAAAVSSARGRGPGTEAGAASVEVSGGTKTTTPSLAAKAGADMAQRSAGKQRVARRRMPVSGGLSGASPCIGGIRLT
jgi:hypothetical protein